MVGGNGSLGDALGYYAIQGWGASVGGSGSVVGVRLQAFVRQPSRERPFGVVNDYVSSRLGMAIGLPVPPGSLIRVADTYGYVSLGFSHKGDQLPPAILPRFALDNPWETSGVIAFDQWIANNDRHDENLAYAPNIGMAVFDHDLALISSSDDPASFLASGLDLEIKNHPLAPFLATAEHFDGWYRRIGGISRREIRRVVNECSTAGLIEPPVRTALCDFLEHRQSRVSGFIERTRNEFVKVTSWPLGSGEVNDVS